MNNYSINLSSNSSSGYQITDELIFDDATKLNVNLLHIYEDVYPGSVHIDWGDGYTESISNEFFKRYRETSIINEVIYGKFTKIPTTTYSHTFYPSATALYKSTTAQIRIDYVNGSNYTFNVPITIRSGDYYETIFDLDLVSTAIMPLSSNIKSYTFATEQGSYILETTT